jgi:hypothetical protein
MGSDELERETGGQGWVWRLTGRGLGREEREKRGGGISLLFHSIHKPSSNVSVFVVFCDVPRF